MRLHPSLGWRTEVPLHGATSLSAWDAVVRSETDRTAIDAETRIRDGQALTRRLELKFERDRTVARLVVLVADTRNNRRAFELIREGMREAFPLDSRDPAAFARGESPAAGGIVVL